MPAHAADLLFSYPSPVIAAAIHGALSPETDAQPPKTRSRVILADTDVCVHVEADDLASLRAALNSYLRWADAAERAAGVARR